MGWRETAKSWGGAALYVVGFGLLIGTCSYGQHHARAVHGLRSDGVVDDAWTSIYYAAESVIASHGPDDGEVYIGDDEVRLRNAWGAPLKSFDDESGGTYLFWPLKRPSEVMMIRVKSGRVVLIARVPIESLRELEEKK